MFRILGFLVSILEFVWRISGEVCDHTVWVLQIEYFENRVVCGLVLALYNRISHAHFFCSHVVFKYSFSVQTGCSTEPARFKNPDGSSIKMTEAQNTSNSEYICGSQPHVHATAEAFAKMNDRRNTSLP